jgi:ATP-binding protein involved in chromosome partitioning
MPDALISEADVLRSLQSVTDPEIGRSLASLNMLKGARVHDGSVEVHIDLPTPAYPDRDRISAAVKQALQQQLPPVSDVGVTFSSNVRGKNSGGAIGLRVKNVIAVGSGKGGVGKSTIAAALALGLKHYGARVGLMDADVYGPSIPHLLGVTGRPDMVEPQPGVMRIIPLDRDGLKVLSVGFIVEPEQAIVWRGPMLHKLLTQFLKDTDWGDLDYLIIDLPPGTGDVALTLSQLLGLAGAVVVCTPQQVALLDAVKAISMFNQVKIPVLGIVENMSGEIFGRGGAQDKARQMGIPFLGEVPIEAGIRVTGDAGRISELFSTDNPSKQPLLHVTERVAVEVARSLLSTPTLPTLEIL